MRIWIGAVLLLAVLLGGLAWFGFRLLQPEELVRKRNEHRWRAVTAELQYLARLDQFLSSGAAPVSHASVFLSSGLIDRMLTVSDNVRVPLPRIPGATLLIRSIRSDFRNGFPAARVDARAEQAGESLGVDVRANAILLIEPDGEDLLLRVAIESLTPELDWKFFRGPVRRFATTLLEARALDIAAGLPEVRIPLRSDLPLMFEASSQPVTVKFAERLHAGGGAIARDAPEPSRLGRSPTHAIGRTSCLPESRPTACAGASSARNEYTAEPLDPALAREEQRLSELRTRLSPRVEPLLIHDAGVRLWASRSPAGGRHQRVQRTSSGGPAPSVPVTRQDGALQQSPSGGLGCGYEARLDGQQPRPTSRWANSGRVGEGRTPSWPIRIKPWSSVDACRRA